MSEKEDRRLWERLKLISHAVKEIDDATGIDVGEVRAETKKINEAVRALYMKLLERWGKDD